MKRKIILFIAFISGVSTVSYAQNTFTGGDKVVNLGVGIGNFIAVKDAKTTFMPLSLSYEYCAKGDLFDSNSAFGIGALIGYYGAKYEVPNVNFGYNYNYALFGLRANIHYQFIDRLDTYLGGMFGYNLAVSTTYGDKNLKDIYPSAKAGGLGSAVYVGGRYYFLEKLALFGEVGYGISPLTIGLALKL